MYQSPRSGNLACIVPPTEQAPRSDQASIPTGDFYAMLSISMQRLAYGNSRNTRHVASPFLTLALTALIAAAGSPVLAQSAARPAYESSLRTLVDGKQRTAPNSVRDPYRRPFDVIQFLEVKPESTVIEISPGAAGYWTEILAPYLKERGLYVAANPAPAPPRCTPPRRVLQPLRRASRSSTRSSRLKWRVTRRASPRSRS